MHIVIRILLFWSLLGSLIPCAIIAAPMFLSSKYSVRTKVIVLVVCWPQLTIVALLAGAWAILLSLRQKLHPRALVPPPPPAPGRG